MNEDKSCKIVATHQDVGIHKLKCETHDQYLLYIYTYRDLTAIICQVGEDNHTGGDKSFCVDSIGKEEVTKEEAKILVENYFKERLKATH